MKIVVLSSNSYVWLLPAFAYCLNKHWPGKPAVDVVHYDVPPPVLPDNFHAVAVGSQEQYTWSRGLISYLASISDEIVLLLLEDFFLLETVNLEALQELYSYMEADSRIAKIELSYHRLGYAHEDYAMLGGVQMLLSGKETLYQTCVQAALWRKDMLMLFLDPHEDAWQFEVQGTQRMIEARRLGLWSGLILGTKPPILSYEHAVWASAGECPDVLSRRISPKLREELRAAGVLPHD